MDLYEKISILGPSAQFDTCGPKDFGLTTNIPGVYRANIGGGRVCRLFKVLQTNVCQNNCHYCAFRRDRATPRVSATPEEMARAFDSAWSRRLVEGLFLSSSISGTPENTMTRMLNTAEILRQKYHYTGYVHLKIMPGVSAATIRAAANIADRISLNIESPTAKSLAALSPEKDLRLGFYYTLSLIKQELRQRRWSGKRVPSVTTQFVVGAGDETDREIIQVTHLLYKSFGLKRVFYSAFRPVLNTPLQDKPAASPTREHRLYQTDFLMRFYRFTPWDIPLDPTGTLIESVDPKLLWAQRHPEIFPINLNQADYWQILKVPGLGPTSARKIIALRQKSAFFSLDQLRGRRLPIAKIAQYTTL